MNPETYQLQLEFLQLIGRTLELEISKEISKSIDKKLDNIKKSSKRFNNEQLAKESEERVINDIILHLSKRLET